MNGLYKTNDDKKSIISNGITIIESVVYTDPKFAKRVIKHFEPQFQSNDTFLDPCKGEGAFFNALPKPKSWCELQKGKDFLTYDKKADWIITNPPWSGRTYVKVANKCFQTANNVVFLVKLFGALGTNRRLRDADNNNMGLKEIIIVDWKDANFTYLDGSQKASEGFSLSLVHWQKNWTQGTKWNYEWVNL